MPNRPTGRKCKGHKPDGSPCKNWAIRGGEVCGWHGGRAPQVRAKAKRRVLEARVARELGRLDVEPMGDPLRQMQVLAAQVWEWKDALGERVAALGSIRYSTDEGGEQLRAEVALFERAMDRCSSVLTAMARLDIDERLTAVTEAQAGMLCGLLDRVMGRLGLPEEQRVLAAAAVVAELEVLVGGSS